MQKLLDRRKRGRLHRIVVLAGDLQREILTEEIGQRQNQRQYQHHRNEDVFPARILKHLSGALQRALRHQRCDLSLLHLHAHAIGDLDGDEGIANIGDAAEDAARGHDLITHREP